MTRTPLMPVSARQFSPCMSNEQLSTAFERLPGNESRFQLCLLLSLKQFHITYHSEVRGK